MKKWIPVLLVFFLMSCNQTTENMVWLSDLDLSLVDMQRGQAGKNVTPMMNSPIVIAGKTFENGVGIMAPAKYLIASGWRKQGYYPQARSSSGAATHAYNAAHGILCIGGQKNTLAKW